MKQLASSSGYFRSKCICAAAVFALSSCAGRAPQPVAVVQPQDRYMDCTAVQAEIAANTKTVQGLGSEEGEKVAQNVAAGVAGLIIWPLWFAMDFQGAAGKEEAALQSRQQYLATLALQRGCAVPTGAPAAPALPVEAVQLAPIRTIAAAQPASAPLVATAVQPAQVLRPNSTAVIAPQPSMPMTPCGEDRPCSLTQSTIQP